MLRAARDHALRVSKHIKRFVRRPTIPERHNLKDVPYYSQWESPKLVKKFLEKELAAEDDPKWKNSGAKTKAEYTAWSWSGCGMACTKMLLAHRTGKVVPLVALGKKCAEYGGYVMPLETSPGLFFKPYVTFLKKEYGLTARIEKAMLPAEIMHELSRDNYVIASVNPQIRYPDSQPKHKGGHLVLMLGYDLKKKEFYLHNPSGIFGKSQADAVVSFAEFKKFFSGKAIVVDANSMQGRE